MSSAGEALDRALGRDLGEAVTVDLDATQITVYGRKKEGAARCRTGQMSYAPHHRVLGAARPGAERRAGRW